MAKRKRSKKKIEKKVMPPTSPVEKVYSPEEIVEYAIESQLPTAKARGLEESPS